MSALDAAIKAATCASPNVYGPNGARHVLVPAGFSLIEAHNRYILPPQIWDTHVTVDTRDSLVRYANRFSDIHRSILIADYDNGSIRAALDWHAGNKDMASAELSPGARQHNCVLKLRPSEEFERWSGFENTFHSQADMAEFLEENAVDVSDPEPTVLIEISRDLEGTQGVVFKSATRLECGDRTFVYETETKAKGGITVPREFTLSIPLYAGEEPIPLRCAFRWRINGGTLQMGFMWRRVEYQRRAHFATLATAASEETGLPVMFGRAGDLR